MTKPKTTKGEVVPFRQPPPKTMLQVIAEAVRDPRCDVAKMQALLAMQRDLEAEGAKKAFNRAFIDLQSEMPSIRRDGKIVVRAKDASGSREHGRVLQATPYAKFEDIHSVVMPICLKHGFTLGYETYSDPAPDNPMRMMLKGILLHIGGHERISTFPIIPDVTGSKNAAQGQGSGQSYAKRYVTIALLNIVSHAPQDRDRDGYDPQTVVGEVESDDPISSGPAPKKPASDFPGDKPMPINQEQFARLVEVMTDCGVNDKAVLDKYRIKKLTDLPASLFEAALAACANYKKAKGSKHDKA